MEPLRVLGLWKPVGAEINAMGNSNIKKTQASRNNTHQTRKVKSIWSFKHVDIFKSGKGILQDYKLYICDPAYELYMCVLYTVRHI